MLMGPLNVQYSRALTLKTSPNCHSLQICHHTHSLTGSQWSQLLANDRPCRPRKLSVNVRNGGPTRPEGCFLSQFMQSRREMAYPGPTKAFLQLSPEVGLFVAFGCTHCPSPVLPFLLKQNLSPKDIAGSEITSTKSSEFNRSH